ncbi:hypothetical protein AB9R81_21265 [Vibrio cyclitrophicus]|uniref:hypothetical protein n=1 Tax=Vibrio cyclitrophicus TaxID=47951 RepID=UPI000C83C6FD|nr:hypothetical protein [Vibrio cyclitrophicus]PMI07685.1 hypothetical protein BCU52_15355 [Vibrio cyclitrophicus]
MDKLSITTHLMAILTAFSAFTMPIALEVLNRVKSRYGSAYYMDSIEEIMGFKVHYLFRELILTLVALMFFSVCVAFSSELVFAKRLVLFFELVFAFVTAALLIKEFRFIKTILLATRSDDLVTDYLIDKLSEPESNHPNHAREIELLIQIACYNIENTTAFTEESIENRLFGVIEKAYLSHTSSIHDETIKKLIDGLAVVLTSARSTNNRKTYVSLQRNYAQHLIIFFDRKVKNHDVFEQYSDEFYEESIKELSSGNYWLMKADFLISVNMWDLKSPQTVNFIDKIIRNLIDLAAREKPDLVPDILERYRNFVGYESYFTSDLHNLLTLFGSHSADLYDEIRQLIASHEEQVTKDPEAHVKQLVSLVDKAKIEAIKSSTSIVQYEQIKSTAIEFEQEMILEIIKSKGGIASRSTAQYAITTLAKDNLWGHIISCFESFSPAHSTANRLGFDVLPCSLSHILEQLGKSHGFSYFDSEELANSYQRAVPILIMYILYRWRIQNPSKSLRKGVDEITTTITLTERTIRNVRKIQSAIPHIKYHVKSKEYSHAFCKYFNIMHEESEFHKSSLIIIDEIGKYLYAQLENIIATQPLSKELKNRYMDAVAAYPENRSRRIPLLEHVSLIQSKQAPIVFNMPAESRATFLDNNDVHYSFNSRGVIERIHNHLAFKQIEDNGLALETLSLSDCNDDKLIIITKHDWEAWAKDKPRAELNKVNKHLVYTDTGLNSYFPFDIEATQPIATIYSPTIEGTDSLHEHLRDAFEFGFKDENGSVEIQAQVHIYY